MNLAAAKIGFGVPGGAFEGHVHGVFGNACIIAIGGQRLVTVVPRRTGGLPFGITLDGHGEPDFSELCMVGDRAALRAGILRWARGGISVDIRRATPWRSCLADIALDISRHGVRMAWQHAVSILVADGRMRGLARVAADPIAALVSGVARLSPTESCAAAANLVGLGEGGTPAGDDFLVGLMAALQSAVADDARRAFVARFGDGLRKAAPGTNDVSRLYLEAATAGEISETLTRLVRSIGAGLPPAGIADATAAAIAVGHTSGADGTLGLLCGIAAWGPGSAVGAVRRLVRGVPAGA